MVEDGRLSRRTLRPSRTREGRPIIGIKIILNCCQNSSKDNVISLIMKQFAKYMYTNTLTNALKHCSPLSISQYYNSESCLNSMCLDLC